MKVRIPQKQAITLDSYYEHIEYIDCVILMTLHETYGFGTKRLRRFYESINAIYHRYERYNTKREVKFGQRDAEGIGRMDLYMIKEDLKSIGFDYDKVVTEEYEKKHEKKE